LYRLKTPSQQVAMVLSALAEGLDASAAERVFGYRQTTISSELRRWQPGEHIDDGRHARCSLAPCRRFPLERHARLMGVECHVASKSVMVPAEELVWSLTSG
jgi:hypothetical protein